MNEQIDELMIQAGARFEFLHGVHYDDFHYSEFARYIIQDCIDMVDKIYHEQTGMGNKLGRRQTPYQEIINAIEEHFGVEEWDFMY